jgi:hypothetical protein
VNRADLRPGNVPEKLHRVICFTPQISKFRVNRAYLWQPTSGIIGDGSLRTA